jgi:hypothetical protein
LNDHEIHIEVIGYKDSPPARSRDFFEVWFRAMSRVGTGASRCAIALPFEFERGLSKRALNYGSAWGRLARAFPEIELWLVHHSSEGDPSWEVRRWVDAIRD